MDPKSNVRGLIWAGLKNCLNFLKFGWMFGFDLLIRMSRVLGAFKSVGFDVRELLAESNEVLRVEVHKFCFPSIVICIIWNVFENWL